MISYKLEMLPEGEERLIEADRFTIEDEWILFWRKPAIGGILEYWRVRSSFVVAIETCR